MTRATVTPLESRCAVCLDTGSKSQHLDGDLDCTSCEAVQQRMALREYMAQYTGWPDRDALTWVACQFGQSQLAPVAAQPSVVAAPEGWKLAPVKATPKMIDATWDMVIAGVSENTRNRVIWDAMLAAAPAIAAPVEVERWQPIETAPKGKNGISFMMLAYGPEDDQSVSIGVYIDGSFYAASIFYCLGKTEKPFEIRENKVTPTHWMPIPDTPIDAAIATGDKHE